MAGEQTEFSVVCVSPEGAHFRVRVVAGSAAEAEGLVRARGHDVRGAFAEGLSSREQRRLLEAMRAPNKYCATCGYWLVGLPTDGRGAVRCPECGVWTGLRPPGGGITGGALRRQELVAVAWVSVICSALDLVAAIVFAPGFPACAGLGVGLALLVLALGERRRGCIALGMAVFVIAVHVVAGMLLGWR